MGEAVMAAEAEADGASGLTVQIDEQPENIKEMIYKTAVSWTEPRNPSFAFYRQQKMVAKLTLQSCESVATNTALRFHQVKL